MINELPSGSYQQWSIIVVIEENPKAANWCVCVCVSVYIFRFTLKLKWRLDTRVTRHGLIRVSLSALFFLQVQLFFIPLPNFSSLRLRINQQVKPFLNNFNAQHIRTVNLLISIHIFMLFLIFFLIILTITLQYLF